MTRTIKKENWETLANTLTQCVGHALNVSEKREWANGTPTQYNIDRTVDLLRVLANATYNSQMRINCKSALETLANYGIIDRSETIGYENA